ncbi:hypothetical protein EDD11_004982 [Mortierella claussenii]|nr:hypothetical protein EDD11_004982 [Mortierella claussenii]
MKFLKTTLAVVGALALLASPATAQYGREEQQQQQQEREASSEQAGVAGYFQLIKSLLTGGGGPPPLFVADPTGVIFNVTDANYKDTILEDEWIITFCSVTSAPCADYFPTFLDAAITMQNETHTKFASVWVEENARISARFFIPARLPYVVYAKDGDFRQIPYVRNNTQYLVEFIEEEKYKYYPIMDGPMSPYSTLALYFEKYADGMEWVGQYTSWMPRWMVYIIAGSMSGVVFSLFSGGSSYSSDPSKYPHLNADGTLKNTVGSGTSASSTATSTSTKTTKSSTKKRSSTKKA